MTERFTAKARQLVEDDELAASQTVLLHGTLCSLAAEWADHHARTEERQASDLAELRRLAEETRSSVQFTATLTLALLICATGILLLVALRG